MLHAPISLISHFRLPISVRYNLHVEPKTNRLVLLAVAHDQVEATIWKDILEAEGIGVFVKSKDALATFGVSPLPGTLEVYVQARDEKRARWLLGEKAEPA